MDHQFSKSVFQASKDQVSTELDGEVAILGLREGKYFGLSGVGEFVWALLQVPRSFMEVRDAILAQYDVSPECCEEDLKELMEKLISTGLIAVDKRSGHPEGPSGGA